MEAGRLASICGLDMPAIVDGGGSGMRMFVLVELETESRKWKVKLSEKQPFLRKQG